MSVVHAVDTTYDLSGKAVEFPLQTQALALSQSKCPPVSAPGHGVGLSMWGPKINYTPPEWDLVMFIKK